MSLGRPGMALSVVVLSVLSLSVGRSSGQQPLVGCAALGCQAAGCTVGNTTNAFLGATSFDDGGGGVTGTTQPLTWTVGALASNGPDHQTDSLFTKNFYLGYPPSTNFRSASGCALFFEGIARSIPLNGSAEYGSVTCGQTLGAACVADLLAQAERQVQTSTDSSSAVCATLQANMEKQPPQSCRSIALVTWGSVVGRDLDNLTAIPAAQTSCQLSPRPDYDVALIETQTVSTDEVSSDVAPFFYSVTPVLTVFYRGAATAETSPQAFLSCLKIVDNDSTSSVTTTPTPSTGAATAATRPSSGLSTLLWSVWLLVAAVQFAHA